ncbi:hypothetical protein LNTAR_19357 [Lentisphaera araneosa HTCC2155]|uniref:Uncharacterized protein n=1 Tax=Lentisphaera araneosa HTCC2155 TaxID=313628 RepID=A6DQT7_9BACT|nr:hypothetical protein [Lentisphaera araneosa]EDM25987.1 hypothetical protein LNTAR_19357 [Lentisphaera araneosa HTCC2155]
MKRLRKIALNLNRSDWPNDYGYQFLLRSRCLCNYIERRLKKEIVELIDSTKIVITGEKRENSQFYINSSNIACLNVPFNPETYDLLKEHEYNAYMVNFLKEHITNEPNICNQEANKLFDIITDFENEGSINKFIYKKKINKDKKLKIILEQTLTVSEFVLKLDIQKSKESVYSKIILKTDPDELAFHYRYKDIVFEDNFLIVTSRTSEPLIKLNLDEIEHKNNT